MGWNTWKISPASYRPVRRLVHRSQAKTGSLWARRQTSTRCTSKPDPTNPPSRGMVSGLHRSGDAPVADRRPPGPTRSAATRRV